MKQFSIKKTAAVMIALLMVCSLAACGEQPKASSEAPVSTPAQTQSIEITTAPKTTPEETTAPETTEPETTEEPTTEPTQPETTELVAQPFGEEDLVLTVDGVELSLRMDFVPVMDKIFGGNYDEQVGQACVGGGNDRDYYYDGGNFEVHTVGSANGEQTIYDIYITLLDGYTTAKGAVIGKTTRDEVLFIYGEPSFTAPASERYSMEDLDLIFGFDGDILTTVCLHDNAVQ